MDYLHNNDVGENSVLAKGHEIYVPRAETGLGGTKRKALWSLIATRNDQIILVFPASKAQKASGECSATAPVGTTGTVRAC